MSITWLYMVTSESSISFRSAREARGAETSSAPAKMLNVCFCLGDYDFIKQTLLHMISTTGNPMSFGTCKTSRCWQGDTEGCTRLKSELEAENCFLSPLHFFFFLCLADPERQPIGERKKKCWHFFTGLISLYGILPFIQLFHRSYSYVWQAKTYKLCPKLHF